MEIIKKSISGLKSMYHLIDYNNFLKHTY